MNLSEHILLFPIGIQRYYRMRIELLNLIHHPLDLVIPKQIVEYNKPFYSISKSNDYIGMRTAPDFNKLIPKKIDFSEIHFVITDKKFYYSYRFCKTLCDMNPDYSDDMLNICVIDCEYNNINLVYSPDYKFRISILDTMIGLTSSIEFTKQNIIDMIEYLKEYIKINIILTEISNGFNYSYRINPL